MERASASEAEAAATASPGPTDIESLSKKFENFDDESVYEKVQAAVRSQDARNFVVQFGAGQASIALDLGLEDFNSLLAWVKNDDEPIRWM
jgi:hypothetical protein